MELEANYTGIGIRADAGPALQTLVALIQRAGKPLASDWHGQSTTELLRSVRHRIQERLAAQHLDHELGIMHAIRADVPDDVHTFWDLTIAGYLCCIL